MQKALADKTLRVTVVDSEDDPFTRKSGKSRVVAGRGNKKDDESDDAKIPEKGKVAQFKIASSLSHSSSAPQLKFDPTSILDEFPQQPVAPAIPTQSSAAPKTGISFAEFRRRKAEAAAAGK